MAVQARQQVLQNSPLLCNNSSNNGDGSAVGWVDNRGQLPVDLCRPLQQQRQMTTITACSSALANQQLSAMAYSHHPPPSRVLPAEFSSLASQIDKQKGEIDQFLCLQSERLRVALQQQMKHHLLSLMRTLESKASALLRHKEEELALASKTTAELEERLRRSETESQAWQRMAREHEAMALALSNTLEQVRDNVGLSSASPPDPATSCCNSSSDPSGARGGGRGGELEAWGRQDEGVAGRCRGCRVQDSRVLFLPCMHLCACELCEALLASCPVCGCVKQGSMEVLIS